MADDVVVSLSQVQSYQKCPTRYYYGYVEGLQPRVKSAPMDLGILLHAYLERFYELVQAERGTLPPGAHEDALATMEAKYGKYLMETANTAKVMGAWEEYEKFAGMLPMAKRILERYFAIHGQADAERYEILAIERPLRARIGPGIISSGKADMVTRDRLSGKVLLWEHKSHKRIPSHGYRLRDLQTVLYVAKLRLARYGVQGIVWNYLRTAEPATPSLNRDGKMSRVKLDTTWDTYRAALEAAGLDPAGYADMEDKLRGAEADNFFPRQEYDVNTGGEKILLEDYRSWAMRLAEDRKRWEAGERPIRHESGDCDYCLGAGTIITVLGGPNKPIEYIAAGDRLLAYDGTTYAPTTVTQAFKHQAPRTLLLRFSSGQRLVVTPEHPLHVGGVWLRADQCCKGMQVTHLTASDARSQRMRFGNPMADPAAAASMGQKHRELFAGVPKSSEHKRAIAAAQAADNGASAMIGRKASRGRPSDREHLFVEAYQQAGLPLQYTGDGSYWIGRRNPDFIVPDQQKVVEVQRLDRSYQTHRARVADIEEAGYKVLVVDERLDPASTIADVWQFVHNGDEILSITEGPANVEVFNLACEPHANFFANRLLSHNCDFARICTAVLTGKDDMVIRQMWFTTPDERKSLYGKPPDGATVQPVS